MSILILGGDGYLGWPLSIKLALRYPQTRIVIADNQLRRALVAKCGGNSVTPIEDPQARIAAFTRTFGQDNLSFVDLDVCTPKLEALIAELKPSLVYHLAQQCSAPYSMIGVDEAMFTITNNEAGNMRVLWAVRNLVPDAHLVKLGTFGEYAKGGIDIAEGYFQPTYNGKTADRAMPYPRESDDVYHISKINDTNYISLACRKWGLRVTDVMQSTIFGVYTEETHRHDALYTRFDYDAVWGTVVNRFLAQTVLGFPMTVYGTGLQRTGLMALDDSIGSLASLAERAPERGQHVVINHVTERNHCINDIAELVQAAARARGYSPEIRRGDYNPRQENDAVKASYQIENNYVSSHVAHTPFERVLGPMFDIVERFRDRIRPEVFPPQVRWEK
jgi:UDP-sulfoquinovose synthase